MKVTPRRWTLLANSAYLSHKPRCILPASHIPSRPATMPRSPSISGPMGSLPIPSFLSKRLFSDTPRLRSLNIDNINPHVVAAQYAVRGELAIKSEQYRAQLAKGEGQDLPFDSIISANIGNPQQLDQKPLTFFRQVASLMENPLLLDNEQVLQTQLGYKADVIARARKLLGDVKSVGAYSQSQGAPGIRQSVADFIERRDRFPADPANVYLCAGASSGVNALLSVICASPQTGVLVPIPQYPLYTATLSLQNAHCVPYYLDEESNWSTDVDSIRAALKEAQGKGIDVRAVVVINPGNPTGGSLVADDIRAVLELAAEEKLVVMADEVYQANVFEGEFMSFKKGLRELQRSDKNHDGKFDNLELASLHSISKGMVGECGHRGGYYEMVGFDPEVSEQNPHTEYINTKQKERKNILAADALAGRRANLQIRLNHALRARHRPMPRRLHGQPATPRRAQPQPVRRGIQANLQRPALARARPARRLQRHGGRRVPEPAGRHVPVPEAVAAAQGDPGGVREGQEPGRLLLPGIARCDGHLHRARVWLWTEGRHAAFPHDVPGAWDGVGGSDHGVSSEVYG